MSTNHQRAKPLPPADRRRAIVEAITPLLIERGSPLTSREMAEAAGVSEGTIFSVFPDKASVIIEAVRATIEPTPTREKIDAIDPGQPLEKQLTAIATILIDRSARVGTLVGVLRSLHPETGRPAGAHQFVRDANAAICSSITALLKRHTGLLRVDPERAARSFLALVSASTHPLVLAGEHPDAPEIVDIILHGIATDPEQDR